MKKKILAISAVLGIAALVLSMGTLAYFTDTKKVTNTFTVGNVKIDLIESQLHRVNAGIPNGKTSTSVLWTPDQTMNGTEANTSDKVNSGWTGQYFSDEQIKADAATYKAAGGYYETNATNMVPGSSVRKAPYVINSGKNAAYVRVRALIPKTLFAVIDNGPSMWTTTALSDGVKSKAVDWYLANNYAGSNVTKTVDNIEYYVFDFTYDKPLKPGAMTFWNVWGNIAIDKKATSEDLKNVDKFDVIFEADAIQADGFKNAEDAFAKFDAKN